MLIVHLFLAMHTLIYVSVSLPPGVRGWLPLLLVALPGFFVYLFPKSVKVTSEKLQVTSETSVEMVFFK